MCSCRNWRRILRARWFWRRQKQNTRRNSPRVFKKNIFGKCSLSRGLTPAPAPNQKTSRTDSKQAERSWFRNRRSLAGRNRGADIAPGVVNYSETIVGCATHRYSGPAIFDAGAAIKSKPDVISSRCEEFAVCKAVAISQGGKVDAIHRREGACGDIRTESQIRWIPESSGRSAREH